MTLEDVLLGLERARKTFLIILEDVGDEFCAPKSEMHYSEKERLNDYLAALYLIEDSISREQDKLQTIINKLFEIHKSTMKNQKKSEE